MRGEGRFESEEGLFSGVDVWLKYAETCRTLFPRLRPEKNIVQAKELEPYIPCVRCSFFFIGYIASAR